MDAADDKVRRGCNGAAVCLLTRPPPSLREVDFAKQKTEGIPINIQLLACSPSRIPYSAHFFVFGVNMAAFSAPNTIAAATPPAVAFMPPVNAPISPSSIAASIAPLPKA